VAQEGGREIERGCPGILSFCLLWRAPHFSFSQKYTHRRGLVSSPRRPDGVSLFVPEDQPYSEISAPRQSASSSGMSAMQLSSPNGCVAAQTLMRLSSIVSMELPSACILRDWRDLNR